MAVTNPFVITYAGQAVGGASDGYQLLGPYVIDRSYRTLRLVFDVIVVAASTTALKSASETLEVAYRKRDEDLVVDMGGSTFSFTAGTDYFNPVASIAKSGDPDTDRGFSRAYTVTIEAELPSDDVAGGLLEIKYGVNFEPSRQRSVTVEGSYTATSGATASANYLAGATTTINSFLTALDAAAKWELDDEDYDTDRLDANCQFSRQYTELLADQSSGTRDDTDIKDHRMIFTDLSQHPADSREGIQRLRRVIGSYDCAIDVEQSTDLYALFDDKVKDHVVELFESNFSPTVFAFEDRKISYDETTKRLSATLQFLYQKGDGDNVVEVSQSVAYREQRNLDYTPTHEPDELAYYVDVGWAVVERVWSRTALVLGDELPQRRIGIKARYNEIGDFDSVGRLVFNANEKVNQDGWNVVTNTSQVSEQWIGDPTDGREQLKLTAITETVVERLHYKPGGGTRSAG